jgi:hypothetical protein
MLSSDKLKIICARFPVEDQQNIIEGIEAYLNSLVQAYKNEIDSDFIERITCAILKCSGNNYKKYQKAISLAKQDWRDLLVAAGFANSTTIHLEWLKNTLKSA